MLKLIIGVKGTGKTKTLINMVNAAVESSTGDVVCIEKGVKLRYDVKHQARLINTEDFFRQNLEGEWKQGNRGYRIKNKLHLEFGDRFTWPDMACEEGGDCVFCYGLKDHFGVLCDGTVIPCCLDREGVINLGNIFTDDLQDILHGERAVNLREGFKQRKAVEELCRKCGYARRF